MDYWFTRGSNFIKNIFDNCIYICLEKHKLIKTEYIIKRQGLVEEMNEFLALINRKDLCVKYHCTTCGNMEFRAEAKRLGARFSESMLEADESEVMHSLNYQAVLIALMCVPDYDVREKLLQKWPNVFNVLQQLPGFGGILLTPHFEEFEQDKG